jgi:hypothetical protein
MKVRSTAMTAEQTDMHLVDLIQAEYREMPGLSLTKPQIQRLWSLDSATCASAVEALVSAHVLKRTIRDAYVLAETGH